MKEEIPPIKTLPPKKSGGTSNTVITPTKTPPDEILSALLRLNNHDSFSSIKDESLDIDLSACVTIHTGDSVPVLNGNSFSSMDFWRMLDENAQASQLEMACASDESLSKMLDVAQDTTSPAVKSCSFGTFLRPNPPAGTTSARKTPVKLSPQFESIDHKFFSGIPKDLTITRIDKPNIIKLEPVDQFPDIIIEEERIQEQQQPAQLISKAEVMIAASATLEPAAEPVHKCMTCNGLQLRTQQELRTHESGSHRIIHACSICEREFEQESGLKKHLKTHKTVEARKDSWRKCPDCGKCLKLGSMWMHRKIHSENKKYACDICGQKFVQKINLTHHSRVHTAEKPYECPECQKRFQERSHLQRHQKYHAQTRSYRCEKCGKMYKTERCLKVHNLVHLEQRPFACNVCDKSFISNSKLKQHSNIHTGERPFKCNYCTRDFTNFPNWLKHTRRRHKVDHKTGQQLENIPSYCSKKSTKTTKSVKATNTEEKQPSTASKPKAANTVKVVKTVAVNLNKTTTTLSGSSTTTNIPMTEVATTLGTKQNKHQPKQQQQITKMEPPKLPAVITTISGTNLATQLNIKPTKAKRERKQPMPRQVQKAPKITPTALGMTIKQEQVTELLPSKTKTKQTDFPDFHGLSLTSAEELIMEQALEMEECGLYDAPHSSIGDTDNAISAETAAALQFKIKSEFIDCKDELAINESNKRLLCSSLESSPYSSPASIELPATTTRLPVSPTNHLSMELISSPSTTFYMQPYQLNASQGTNLTRLCSNNNGGNNMTTLCDITSTTSSPLATITTSSLTTTSGAALETSSATVKLLPQMLQQTENGQLNEVSLPSTQTFLNHFFLPMTVNMQQHKQVLPSVETLLFSAQANANLFTGTINSATQPQPPPPTSLSMQRNLS